MPRADALHRSAAIFTDRSQAGRILASKLSEYARRDDVLVLALPRGGVPVAYEIAIALDVPLDVFVVRKVGLPGHEELAIGAIASGGSRLLNEDVIEAYDVDPRDVDDVLRREQAELERREHEYRGDRRFPDLTAKTVILVDDGLATGSTMQVAVEALRREGAKRIVVAVPVAPPETCAAFRHIADAIICAVTPEPFYAVGLWYADFSQTTDEEVRELLEAGRRSDAAVR